MLVNATFRRTLCWCLDVLICWITRIFIIILPFSKVSYLLQSAALIYWLEKKKKIFDELIYWFSIFKFRGFLISWLLIPRFFVSVHCLINFFLRFLDLLFFVLDWICCLVLGIVLFYFGVGDGRKPNVAAHRPTSSHLFIIVMMILFCVLRRNGKNIKNIA